MPNLQAEKILRHLGEKFGASARPIGNSRSLFDISDGAVRIYFRYSKLHDKRKCFYGLRAIDLRELEGRRSFICFLWDDQSVPLFIPYFKYEDIFEDISPASDGQFKVQMYIDDSSTQLYIAQAGRFSVDAHYGYSALESGLQAKDIPVDFTHQQVQSLLGAIGSKKGFDIWVPQNDRSSLDWKLVSKFPLKDEIPFEYDKVSNILEEIDVVWFERGRSLLKAMFEIEHTTSLYSGLLRFNDIYLAVSTVDRFSIVSNYDRKTIFVRQLRRPTFQASGLSEKVSFLEYGNVYQWFMNLYRRK